jgi:hypothetical protein
MDGEGSREIPEEVAYAETHRRYLILRVSGSGVVRRRTGRPSTIHGKRLALGALQQ